MERLVVWPPDAVIVFFVLLATTMTQLAIHGNYPDASGFGYRQLLSGTGLARFYLYDAGLWFWATLTAAAVIPLLMMAVGLVSPWRMYLWLLFRSDEDTAKRKYLLGRSFAWGMLATAGYTAVTYVMGSGKDFGPFHWSLMLTTWYNLALLIRYNLVIWAVISLPCAMLVVSPLLGLPRPWRSRMNSPRRGR